MKRTTRTTSSPTLAIVHADAILPDRVLPDATLLCKDGRITKLGPSRSVAVPKDAIVISGKGSYVSPGFIDIHVHGAAGADYMDGTVEAVRTANRCHASHGTTTILPTTTTGTPEQITAMLTATRTLRDNWSVTDGARIGGVHFYGPYFAPSKTGCHRKDARRDPLVSEYSKALSMGIVAVATCAAELPGAIEFYKAARKRKCLVTCGHSDASLTEMSAAYRAGMRHVDHFWCAMSSIRSVRDRLGWPMQGSMAEFVLMEKGMSTEVLADGSHLAPDLLEFAYRMLGPDRLLLVTDSSRAVDMPLGKYRFGSNDDGPWFNHNGKVGMDDAGGMASTVFGMDHMVRHMKQSTIAPLHDVIRMASLTPAARLGIDSDTGSLAPGKRADLLLLSRSLNVKRVFIGQSEFVAK